MKAGKDSKQLFMLFFCIAALVTGCKGKTTPVRAPVTLPSTFSQGGSVQFNQHWWLDFADPVLNKLVEQALNNNFSLQSSWDRLQQARATLRSSQSGFLPTFTGEGKSAKKFIRNDGLDTSSDEFTTGVSAQYEIDLWGRIRSTAEAARLDMEATAADLDAAAVTLAAEVGTTWFTLVEQSNEITLLDNQIEANEKALEVITSRFKRGQVVLADVLQQKQFVESKKGERASLIAQQKKSEHALAVLLGKPPGSLSFEATQKKLSLLPPLPDTGIPARTILSRPDVRSALHAVEAADQRVAAAVAERFPSLRLSANFTTMGNSISNLFTDYITSLIAGLAGPIMDGGRRKAEVKRARAAASMQLNKYGQTILVAIGEVEDALIAEQQQSLYLKSLEKQLELSKRSVKQVRLRYLKGVENYGRVLTAITSQQGLEQKVLKAKHMLLLYRIQLCKALGSGWQYSGQPQNYDGRTGEQ